MALKDVEERLYKMKKSSPLEEEEFLGYPPPKSDFNKESQREIPQYFSKDEVKKRPPINFYQKSKKTTLALYIIIGILFIALLAEGYFLFKKVSSQKTGIQINIDTTENILLGEAFTLEVTYKNASANLLQDALLLVELPENIKILGSENGNTRLFKKELGDLGPGTTNIERFYLVAMGAPNRIESIKASLQYNIVGFSGRFEKFKTQTITIGGPIIDFNLSVPEKIVSGEEFSFKVNFVNNSNQAISNLKIQLFYPLGFNFSDSDVKPVDGNDVWNWGNLQPKERAEINIQGVIIGEVGSYYEIGANINLIAENQIITLEKKTAMTNILQSPLNISIYINNAKDYIARPGEILEYRIDYQNNTDIALSEVIIKTEITGSMFNLSSVFTNGYFDSLKKQIIWNAGNTPQLKLLNKGDGGSVSFKISTTNTFPTRSFNDKNQTLKVRVTIESPSVPPNSSLKTTSAVAELITKIIGRVDLQSYALFRDAASGIVNKGSFPLKVGKSTNFTIHWKIINYNNDLEEVVLKTLLPQGIGWAGVIGGKYGDNPPQYNERTGEVIWAIKEIPAFSGILLPEQELIFQIVATPSLNQVGNYMKLLEETRMTAVDKFTGQEIEIKIPSIDSSLTSDSTVGKNDGIVQP